MSLRFKWHYLAGGIVLLILLLLLNLVSEGQKDEFSLIGIPDGAAGLLARYILDEKMEPQDIRKILFEPYTLYDCCGSATQYAMGSGHLDVAILCPDAAKELIKKDRRFEIVGPVMVNSDVLITSPAGIRIPLEIAVSQKRSHQREVVRRRFGDKARAVPMIHGAVPFAFAKGIVDGAVVDITKAFSLNGEMTSAVSDGEDISTYVLVMRKSLIKSSRFLRFLALYVNAVQEMDDGTKLLRLMQTYVSADISLGDVAQWKKMKVRFTCPSRFLLQE